MRSFLMAMVLSSMVSPVWAEERPAQQQAVLAIYKELLELDTTHSTGSTTVAAKVIAKRLHAAGYPAKDIALLGAKPKLGNLVARLHGQGTQRPLLLLAHLDVVEAKASDWTVDPFKWLEKDGYFYGRGASDDKAMAAIFVEIMLRLKQSGTKLDRDVILALTADEEGGSDDGAQWLLKNHRELVDAEVVLNEGGGGRARHGKYMFNAVQASEKSYTNFVLEVKNKGGHSSLPTNDNAIYRLANALGRLERFAFPVELSDVTRTYFERAAQTETGQTAVDMAALAKNPNDAKAAERLSQTPAYNAQMKTTCVATRLEAGHADNALPQMARANINCRVLPGHSMDEVRQTLTGVVADAQISVMETEPASVGPNSPLQPAVMALTEQLTRAMWPGVPVIPIMSSGASDSRYFRSAGIAAYGISGIFGDMDDVRAHGRDERMGVKQFFDGQEFLWRFVTAFAGSPTSASKP